MDVSIDQRWGDFVDTAVKDGRYASVNAVIDESLRLLEQRERKLKDLRDTIDASLARGGQNTDEAVAAAIAEALDAWEATPKAA